MYRILIADDEPIERMVLTKKIEENFPGQFEIIQAMNGREAVEMYVAKRCEIVILDIEMPGINGLDAATYIRERDKTCSIIFLTAFDCFTYAKRAIAVKALDYLLKPSEDEELIAVIEEGIQIAERGPNEKVEDDEEPNLEEDIEEVGKLEEHRGEQIRLNIVQDMILDFIQSHYTEDISLQDAANVMNYSDAYFCKLFKQCFNKSFTTYLSEFRVEKAKGLLTDVTINVKEISDKVGYRDSNYFAKVFKRIVGVTPSEYRLTVLGK